jgi:DNA-directed RNA polymerase specialized sigma24 family protein
VAIGDALAQLAVIAALSRHLSSAVSAWRRAGASLDDLAVLQADSVTECWAAVVDFANRLAAGQPLPAKVALVLVDRARSAVRARRRRELRADARRSRLDELDELASSTEPTPAEELAHEIATAVRAGRISASAAAPVFLTRVVGYSTTETAFALGQQPNAVRAVRSRAERALVA